MSHAPPFDIDAAILSYVAARTEAPEDDIITAIEAREEEANGDTSRDGPDVAKALARLVTERRLRWRSPPGKDDLTTPLLYRVRPPREAIASTATTAPHAPK